MTDKKTSNQNYLRTTARIVALVGAVGSLYFMFSTGRGHNQIILPGLFTAWVLSPFAGLFISDKLSNRWTVPAHELLYWPIIVLTIGSLVAYSGAFTPPGTIPVFIFLVLPLTSWIIIVTVYLIAKKISHKSRDANQN